MILSLPRLLTVGLAAVVVAVVVPQAQDGDESGRKSGLVLLEKSRIEPPAAPMLRLPAPPIYVTDGNGFPVVSEAGYVQIRSEGEHFYTSVSLKDAGQHIPMIGPDSGNPAVLWGDVEAVAALARVVDRCAAMPGMPRVGIGDISSRFAGYPDLNGDLVSDHRTHQTGYNVNVLVPCKGRPEVHVHLGAKNEDRYDPAAARRLLDVLIGEGARKITTNVEADLMNEERTDLPPLEGWTSRGVLSKNGTLGYTHASGADLYLIVNKAGHGSHFNVEFGEMR